MIRMMDVQRRISMCARNHAKWRRAASFANSERDRDRYMERAMYWLRAQEELMGEVAGGRHR